MEGTVILIGFRTMSGKLVLKNYSYSRLLHYIFTFSRQFALSSVNFVEHSNKATLAISSEENIGVLSTELSFALLRRYTPMNGTLPQIDGLRVEVTEDEVAIVLGFPWGTIGIDMMNGVGSFLLHTEFKQKLLRDADKVMYSGLIEAMI
nr:hypothetical protein Iba_scaffold1993CG0020 [Ipomoea batatas]GME07848.1 hypothetical protein Iba_scaffold6854CG0160 [Ipomoea batatas]